jgi:hypothetical protein
MFLRISCALGGGGHSVNVVGQWGGGKLLGLGIEQDDLASSVIGDAHQGAHVGVGFIALDAGHRIGRHAGGDLRLQLLLHLRRHARPDGDGGGAP